MSDDTLEYIKEFVRLKNEIKLRNRYFVKSPIFDDIQKYSKRSTVYIDKGEKLWRARKFTTSDSRMLLETDMTKFMQEEAINNFCTEFEGPFWGYDEKESYTPPSSLASDARANPKYISYLYTARDIITAITEIRPRLSSLTNIAEIEVVDNLKIYDFTSWGCSSDTKYDLFYSKMSREFSTPVEGELEDYLLSQCFSEFIKSIGYDGIQYSSSIRGYKPGTRLGLGNCVTIFYPDKCKVIGSKIYKVNKIEISADCVFPISNNNEGIS